MTDTERLKKIIDESGFKKGFLAEKLGLSTYGFMLKVNGENEFKVSEVSKLCDLLHIDNTDTMMEVFFCPKG